MQKVWSHRQLTHRSGVTTREIIAESVVPRLSCTVAPSYVERRRCRRQDRTAYPQVHAASFSPLLLRCIRRKEQAGVRTRVTTARPHLNRDEAGSDTSS